MEYRWSGWKRGRPWRRFEAIDYGFTYGAGLPQLLIVPLIIYRTESNRRRNRDDYSCNHRQGKTFSRPAARFYDGGDPALDTVQALEVRASAALGCRRYLWYAATGYVPTNPPTEKSLMAMEAGNALEPVVMGAMERAGWRVNPADPKNPQTVTVRLGSGLLVTGHPDGTVRLPVLGGQAGPDDGKVQMFLFDEGGKESASYGEEKVVEVKTRGPEAFKRWHTLGAERSHPAAAAQAAVYTLGQFGEMRNAVIACMDTGNRTWDHEVIPADRLERALQDANRWLEPLTDHHALHGPDPDSLPDRDFLEGSWQCRFCPFLDVCQPGEEEMGENREEPEEKEVSDEEAQEAVAVYTKAQQTMKAPEKVKRAALKTLKAWMRRKGDAKATIAGRTVSLVQSRRYAINYTRLNSLLDPEVRAEIVTERESEYVRVT